MMRNLICVVFVTLSLFSQASADTDNLRKVDAPVAADNSTLGLCGYSATCSVGGITGVCVSISAGCCSGGAVTSGLCPGSSDIRCCTSHPCSTPQGSGTCKQTGACSGTHVAGYCSGPSDVQCCIGGGGGCTLGSAVSSGNCDATGQTAGLTNQIIAELGTMGYTFRQLNGNYAHCPGFTCTLQSSAADSLENAARSVNDYITLNSAFRSSAEQYLLYKFYQAGRCGITLAAVPGQSNHEGGRAVDTSNYNYWNGVLPKHGWTHTYPSSDPVHFDYTGSSNIASKNLQAFQRLYNRHTGSKIAEDGVYGPNTEAALKSAPCNGW